MDPAIVASLVIIGIRLVTAPLVLIWPVGGVIINIVADALDRPIAQHFGWGLFGNGHYQYIDKILDTWYLFFLFLVLCRWSDPLARRTGKILFFWRLAGVAAFEITGWRYVLVFAPNIIENFYILWTVILKWFSPFRLSTKRLVVILLVVGVPKIFQEISMHWVYPDIAIRDVLRYHVFPELFK
jgi:hypothetical protein